jgi:hypothetical protein
MLQLVLLDGVDGADILMVQRRCCPRLALKALQHLAVPGHIRRQELKRNVTVKLRVLGFVDHTHAA